MKITVIDITGSRHADITLNPAITCKELIAKLLEHKFLDGLESGQVYTITCKRSFSTLQPKQSLQNAGIKDGDMLILGVMTRGG